MQVVVNDLGGTATGSGSSSSAAVGASCALLPGSNETLKEVLEAFSVVARPLSSEDAVVAEIKQAGGEARST